MKIYEASIAIKGKTMYKNNGIQNLTNREILMKTPVFSFHTIFYPAMNNRDCDVAGTPKRIRAANGEMHSIVSSELIRKAYMETYQSYRFGTLWPEELDPESIHSVMSALSTEAMISLRPTDIQNMCVYLLRGDSPFDRFESFVNPMYYQHQTLDFGKLLINFEFDIEKALLALELLYNLIGRCLPASTGAIQDDDQVRMSSMLVTSHFFPSRATATSFSPIFLEKVPPMGAGIQEIHQWYFNAIQEVNQSNPGDFVNVEGRYQFYKDVSIPPFVGCKKNSDLKKWVLTQATAGIEEQIHA